MLLKEKISSTGSQIFYRIQEALNQSTTIFPLHKVLKIINFSLYGLIIIVSFIFVREIVLLRLRPETGFKKIAFESDTPKKDFSSYASIVKNNPFGAPPLELKSLMKTKPDTPSITSINKTNIVLVGTAVSSSNPLNHAIFAKQDGTQEVVKLGNNIFAIGMLKKVGKDHVIVKRGHEQFVILFEDIQRRKKLSLISPSLFSKKTDDGYIINRKILVQSMSNPRNIFTDARLIPNIKQGKQQGFLLSEVKAGGLYHNLGLKNGDIILKINGRDITSPERALQILTAIKGLDRVELNIIRKNKKQTLNYFIR